MMGKTHILGGALAGLVVAHVMGCSVGSTAVVAVVSAVGATFPDIDCPTSKIGHAIPILPTVINKAFGHRGLFHSPLFYALLYCIAIWFLKTSVMGAMLVDAFFVGIYSHIILDTFNGAGIPWLYPFKKKRFHIASITTDSGGEILFTCCLAIAFVGVVALPYIKI